MLHARLIRLLFVYFWHLLWYAFLLNKILFFFVIACGAQNVLPRRMLSISKTRFLTALNPSQDDFFCVDAESAYYNFHRLLCVQTRSYLTQLSLEEKRIRSDRETSRCPQQCIIAHVCSLRVVFTKFIERRSLPVNSSRQLWYVWNIAQMWQHGQ